MGDPCMTRLALEATWRARVQVAQQRYYEACAKHQEVVEERRQRLTCTPDGALAVRKAAKAEVAARREYMRVLHIFTQFVVHGQEPKQ
jgi:hypothetical protein